MQGHMLLPSVALDCHNYVSDNLLLVRAVLQVFFWQVRHNLDARKANTHVVRRHRLCQGWPALHAMRVTPCPKSQVCIPQNVCADLRGGNHKAIRAG